MGRRPYYPLVFYEIRILTAASVVDDFDQKLLGPARCQERTWLIHNLIARASDSFSQDFENDGSRPAKK